MKAVRCLKCYKVMQLLEPMERADLWICHKCGKIYRGFTADDVRPVNNELK